MTEGRGKHPGGRPTLIEGERLMRATVTIPRDLYEWCWREGDGNVSRGLRRLLEELDQRQGAEAAAPPASSSARP